MGEVPLHNLSRCSLLARQGVGAGGEKEAKQKRTPLRPYRSPMPI